MDTAQKNEIACYLKFRSKNEHTVAEIKGVNNKSRSSQNGFYCFI